MKLKPSSISGPIKVERHDHEGGLISYEVWDHGPTYHMVCVVHEDFNENAKAEAEFIALALNSAIGALMAIERSAMTTASTEAMS